MNSPTDFPWPRVIRVDPLDGQRLMVRLLASGEERLLDPLGGLCWPEGEDLAPDGLERYFSLPPRQVEGGSEVEPG